MPEPSFIDAPHGTRIAYHQTPGAGPGIIFLGGFMSDMTGSKALALEDWCRAHGRACLRFDYQGHGVSSGRFADGTIGLWVRDALFALDRLSEGPQVVVGSSMGGWIALHLALARPNRVKALVGIAAAPDFTTRMWEEDLPEAARQAILQQGYVEIPTEYDDEPYVITKAMIDDGWQQRVMGRLEALTIPMRLIHGTADSDVPMSTAFAIARAATKAEVDLIIVPEGGHRLSEPRDMKRLTQTVANLVAEIQ